MYSSKRQTPPLSSRANRLPSVQGTSLGSLTPNPGAAICDGLQARQQAVAVSLHDLGGQVAQLTTTAAAVVQLDHHDAMQCRSYAIDVVTVNL